MRVVGHEHICVDPHAEALRGLVQRVSVADEVIVIREGCPAVVAALDDVHSNSGSHESRQSGHWQSGSRTPQLWRAGPGDSTSRDCGSDQFAPVPVNGVRTIVLTPFFLVSSTT